MHYCCCEIIEKLCLCFVGILTGSKESKATKALEDTRSIESTESIESIESNESTDSIESIENSQSDESIENIESIERYEQKRKVSRKVNEQSERAFVLCECDMGDSYKRITQSLVVTIYNWKIIKCFITNANLVFVPPRRVWSAYTFKYIKGYLCIEAENDTVCLSRAVPISYLSKYITKGTVPLLENDILTDTSTKEF